MEVVIELFVLAPRTNRISSEPNQAVFDLKKATFAPLGSPVGLQGEIPFLIRIYCFISSAF